MENTICPWCQTEIVWDEEIGPEEECPHCNNELKGYRSLSISLGSDEEEMDEEIVEEHEAEDSDSLWDDEESNVTIGGKYSGFGGEETDLLAYEAGLGKVLEVQEEAPECPQCREYMILTGQQVIHGEQFASANGPHSQAPLLEAPVTMNVFVCSSCFYVSHYLGKEDRLRLIKGISDNIDK